MGNGLKKIAKQCGGLTVKDEHTTASYRPDGTIKSVKYTRYQDIPQFTRSSNYRVDVSWDYLEDQLRLIGEGGGLDMDPDFQRAHVWTEKQQIRYVEFILRGGRSANDIYWNCPTWSHRGDYEKEQPVVLVDGKQRLHAVQRFLGNEIPAFGSLKSEYTDKRRIATIRFTFHINDLKTRKEVLQWYLDINAGGVAHTEAEISRVVKLLEGCADEV